MLSKDDYGAKCPCQGSYEIALLSDQDILKGHAHMVYSLVITDNWTLGPGVAWLMVKTNRFMFSERPLIKHKAHPVWIHTDSQSIELSRVSTIKCLLGPEIKTKVLLKSLAGTYV